ncbi:flagellar export chaperone FliS [Opitutus sp. ER46]|uniref:flagellar export chaperone FliS n=1 Tax=Opitutus sp. ER46 TaxID=2161864 RepID=UPI000D31DBFD|nr:flagellar export chaperone FliS [Opitutus sp. ER46]PTX90880.1 flagellar export chaperone FliS [Opitutus sp. ER46]
MLAQSYARTYRANAVLTASPGQLVLMLYDGILTSLALAQEGFKQPTTDPRRIENINHHLLKAQAIITELQAGLNMDAGGDFAKTMHRLYDYHNRRLLEANLRKQVEPVVEVERLVRELRDAWAQMLTQQESGTSGDRVRGVA